MKISFCRHKIGGMILVVGCVVGGGNASAEDIGLIRVESTTIDDRFDQKREESSSIAIISGDEVDAAHTESIQQMLQSIPGITTEVKSGDNVKIHIRGVENQVFMGEKPGVAVVIDGVPVFERTGSVNIDLDNIESIKVIKGGASYLFGDDALAGAVIITTKRGAKQAGYKVATEVGSFGASKTLVRAGFSGDKGNGHVQMSRRDVDGYYDDSASRADYVDGKLQYYINDSSDLTFGFENAHRKKNSHGSVRGVTAAEIDPKSTDPEYNDYANKFDVHLGKYYVTYSNDIDDRSNMLVNVYHFGDHTQYYSSPIRYTENDYNYFNDYRQAQRGIKSEYRVAGSGVAWMAGLDLRDNAYDSKSELISCDFLGGSCTPDEVGKIAADGKTGEQVAAAYGELKFKVSDKLVLTTNGRIEQIDLAHKFADYKYRTNATETGDEEASFEVSSYRLGANYAMRDNLDFYTNYSTGFRAPSVEQLFLGSKNPTSAVEANENLDPEFAYNMEVGLRAKTLWGDVPVDIDLSVFQIDRKDHIQASAGQYTTGTDNVYENAADMRNRGLELSVRTDPARKWSLGAAYTYLDARYTRYDQFNLGVCTDTEPDGSCVTFPVSAWSYTSYDNSGNVVPRTPNHHLNLALRHRPAPHWLITAEMDAISSYYADEINQEKIDGHEVYNLLINYDVAVGAYSWSLFARIDNVFDERYYNVARGYNDSNYDGVYNSEDLSIVVNQGRTYTAGVSVQF